MLLENGILSKTKSSIQTVYTKIWKKSRRDSKAPKIMSSRNQLHADRNRLIRMQKTGIDFLQIAPADNDKGYDRRRDMTCWTLQKRERLESKLS